MTRRIGMYEHPERKPHEVLVAYFTAQAAQFAPYETKRLGGPTDDGLGEAADPHGNGSNDTITYPLFVSEKEAVEKGLIPHTKQ